MTLHCMCRNLLLKLDSLYPAEPTGCVVANDADSKRAYMLVHQLRRINSPAVFVTTCDAQFFPLVRSEENPTEGIFDRVLCDVPCSGDGTSRKNPGRPPPSQLPTAPTQVSYSPSSCQSLIPGVWKKWNALNAYGLHALQLSIALKGARLTRVGGYLCYSTCSMNPIENESVVAELLRASEGSLELVDRRSDLTGLLARPGFSTWRVLSELKSRREIKDKMKKNNEKMKARRKEWEEKQGDIAKNEGEHAEDEVLEIATSGKGEPNDDEEASVERVPIRTEYEPASMDDAQLKKMAQMAGLNEYSCVDDVPWNMQKRIRKSCFPPTEEEASQFHLGHCMRVLPHDMDTGGFFVALLKKTAPISPRARKIFQKLEEELRDNDTAEEVTAEPLKKKTKLDSASSADGIMAAATAATDGLELLPNEEDKSTGVRGYAKKHYLADKDGKKHSTLGRDDFIPVAKDIFQPLKGNNFGDGAMA